MLENTGVCRHSLSLCRRGFPLSHAEVRNLKNQKPGNHPNFKKKRSGSEKAILGATLGIPGHSRSHSRNGSYDLIYVKTLFSEQLSERLSEVVGRQNFSPNFRSVFSSAGTAHESVSAERARPHWN